MKIIQLIPVFEIGGAQKMVLSFTKFMIEAGHDVHVLVLRKRQGTYLEDELDQLCDSVHYLNKPKGFCPVYSYKLYRMIRSIQPDVVHSHMYSLRYLWLSVAALRLPRFFHTIHNTAKEDASRPYWLNLLFQRLLFITRVTPVSISKEINESVRTFYRINYCHNIYNGIDLPQNVMVERGVRDDSNDCIFVCVATFKGQKNHVGLLKFFKEMLIRQDNIYLKLIGEGPLLEATKQLAHDLGIERHVQFMGARSDVGEQLQAADIFILLSHHEGNPLSVMEAMAAQLLVVATGVGGVPDLITDGIDGIIIDPGHRDSSISRVLSLVNNPSDRRRIGTAARVKAEGDFSAESMSKHYLDLYESK